METKNFTETPVGFLELLIQFKFLYDSKSKQSFVIFYPPLGNIFSVKLHV